MDYEIPGDMKPGTKTRCTVRIAGNEVSMEAISISAESDHITMNITNEMGVKLLDLNEGKDFKITTLSSEKQSIEAGNYSEWVFYVEPLKNKSGIFVLILQVTAYYGGKQKDCPIIEKSINTKKPGKKRIVFLAADTHHDLKLADEEKIISTLLKSKARKFEYSRITELNAYKLNDVLIKENPCILHYSGHGEVEGILLFDEDQNLVVASTESLKKIFQSAKSLLAIECIILNSCFSRGQAAALRPFCRYLIGTTSAIEDQDAISFSEAFYRNIQVGLSIRKAYDSAMAQLAIDVNDQEIKSIYNWF